MPEADIEQDLVFGEAMSAVDGHAPVAESAAYADPGIVAGVELRLCSPSLPEYVP